MEFAPFIGYLSIPLILLVLMTLFSELTNFLLYGHAVSECSLVEEDLKSCKPRAEARYPLTDESYFEVSEDHRTIYIYFAKNVRFISEEKNFLLSNFYYINLKGGDFVRVKRGSDLSKTIRSLFEGKNVYRQYTTFKKLYEESKKRL